MKYHRPPPKIKKNFLRGFAAQTPHNIPPKFSFVNLVNLLISKIMYTNFTAGRFKKKYHPISTNPMIGVRGGVKLLRTHGKIKLVKTEYSRSHYHLINEKLSDQTDC